MSLIEEGRILKVDLGAEKDKREFMAAKYLLRDHFDGARATVFMDKDETMQLPDAADPSDPRLATVLKQGEERGIMAGIDSNSSPSDLLTLGKKLGMEGVHVAERGAVICGLSDNQEIQLTQSGDWLNKLLLHQFAERVRQDPKLNEQTVLVFGDPWAMINGRARIPGSKKQLIMLNSGRHASAGMVTGLLDTRGNIIRKTEESRAFFEEMADLFIETRDALNETHPFPDVAGMMIDRSKDYEVVNMVSLATDKRIAMAALRELLGIPIFHIGDSEQDNMTGIEGVTTMAVGNNTLRNGQGIISASLPLASGIIELYEKYILPKAETISGFLPEPKERTIARYEASWRDVRRKVLRINGIPLMISTNQITKTISIQEGFRNIIIGPLNGSFNWRGLSNYISQKTEDLGFRSDISQGHRGYLNLQRLSRDGNRIIGDLIVITGILPNG